MNIRTRFSPSPTGMMHIGNARAALFSALYAVKNQGTFILRIEDTDAVRSEERFVESLQDDLHWLGIDWQEGPNANGSFGPYWQSQRQESVRCDGEPQGHTARSAYYRDRLRHGRRDHFEGNSLGRKGIR